MRKAAAAVSMATYSAWESTATLRLLSGARWGRRGAGHIVSPRAQLVGDSQLTKLPCAEIFSALILLIGYHLGNLWLVKILQYWSPNVYQNIKSLMVLSTILLFLCSENQYKLLFMYLWVIMFCRYSNVLSRVAQKFEVLLR